MKNVIMELKVISDKSGRPSLNEMQDFVGGNLELENLTREW